MLKAFVSDHSFPSIDLQKKVFEQAGLELVEVKPNCTTEDEVISRCKEAGVLLVQWAPITRRVLHALPDLKGVVRYGIGVDNIDLRAAKELDIRVANVPTYCLEEVSNHTLSFILSLGRRIAQNHFEIAHGGWGIGRLLPIPSFFDLTLGLVGFGAIARMVAKKASVFGFHIVAADPYINDSVFNQNGVERVDLPTLFSTADILSLHCPLTPQTTHLIRHETIQSMKPGVIVINTARGPIIREQDLVDALATGRILGAGMDVFEQEPLAADSPLRKMSNVILTSHAASVSNRAVEMLQVKAAESARDFLQDKQPEGMLV